MTRLPVRVISRSAFINRLDSFTVGFPMLVCVATIVYVFHEIQLVWNLLR